MDSIIKKASSVEQALKDALTELNLTEEDVDVEVINKGGILSQAEIKVTVKQSTDETARIFVNDLLNVMGLDCTAELVKDENGKNFVNINGKDNGIAIGYRGEVLDAIQYLTMLSVNRDRRSESDFAKITVNSENYREKRTETLTELAQRLATKVLRTGRCVELEPMNPFERRIVHTALQDNDKVTTDSVGIEPNRYVVIKPVNYVQKVSNDFKKYGPQRMRSYGGKKR